MWTCLGCTSLEGKVVAMLVAQFDAECVAEFIAKFVAECVAKFGKVDPRRRCQKLVAKCVAKFAQVYVTLSPKPLGDNPFPSS